MTAADYKHWPTNGTRTAGNVCEDCVTRMAMYGRLENGAWVWRCPECWIKTMTEAA